MTHGEIGLLLLDEGDNVLIATRQLEAGPHRTSTGTVVEVRDPVELGHKVAGRPILTGDRVVRYGMPIGRVTADIETGAWVHTHNLESEYLPTFERRGGEK